MKRYDLVEPDFLDGAKSIKEVDNGKYVKYDDIKDDRALLEEAVMILKTVIGPESVDLDAGQVMSFLKRAKERGMG